MDPVPSLTPEARLPETPEAWARAFARAHPDWRCLRCGSENPPLVVPADREQDLPLSVIRRASGTMIAYVPTIAAACQNCGHIEIFDQEVILRRAGEL